MYGHTYIACAGRSPPPTRRNSIRVAWITSCIRGMAVPWHYCCAVAHATQFFSSGVFRRLNPPVAYRTFTTLVSSHPDL